MFLLFWFFYILLHGREEWDKRVKQPVWSVFPNYLSVSCDYGKKDLTEIHDLASIYSFLYILQLFCIVLGVTLYY